MLMMLMLLCVWFIKSIFDFKCLSNKSFCHQAELNEPGSQLWIRLCAHEASDYVETFDWIWKGLCVFFPGKRPDDNLGSSAFTQADVAVIYMAVSVERS